MNNKIKQRVDLIIEYIEQILSDEMKIKSNIEINREIIDGKKTLVLDIYVPMRNYERHFNLDILEEDEIELLRYLMDNLIEKFMTHSYIGISKYYDIHSAFDENSFYGIEVTNINGSYIKLSFSSNKKEFREIVAEYDNKIDEYMNLLREKGSLEDNVVRISEINIDKLSK